MLVDTSGDANALRDDGLAHPQLLVFLDAQSQLEYLIAVAKNTLLKRKVKMVMPQARLLSCQSQQTEHAYGDTWYVARK